MKIAYVIPGFNESAKQEKYRKITNHLKKKGIMPIEVKIKWKYRTMSDYINQFLKIYQNFDNKNSLIIGFSFGAMVAFIASQKIRPKKLILCSLSPYFNEDLKKLRKGWKKYVGKRRVKDLNNYSCNVLSKKIDCETILLVGDKEDKFIQKRVIKVGNKIKRGKVYFIKNAGHDIANKNYLKELLKHIK